jgi:hypothetical protein
VLTHAQLLVIIEDYFNDNPQQLVNYLPAVIEEQSIFG